MIYKKLKQRQYWWASLLLLTGLVLFYVSCKKTDKGDLSSNLTISPNSGPAGNLVTITGSGFNADITQDSVQFNGLSAHVINVSSTQLQVYVPIGVTTGPVTVFVGARQVTGPVYTVSSVSVSSLGLTEGLAGDSVTINGLGLSNTGALNELAGPPTVKFNGKQAIVVSATPTQVVALVPGRAETGPVTLTVGGQTATGPVFNYLGIDTLHPITGNTGTVVTMTGGFGTNPGQDTVTFNGVRAVIDSSSPTKLIVTVPAGAQTGRVVVKTGGRSIPGPVFTFVALPTISAFSPASGPVGIKVTITGTGFSKNTTENSVSFNGVPAAIISTSPTQLVVAAPAGVTTGIVAVTVNSLVAKGTVFTVQGLGISSLSPANFVPAAVDTINGVGFSATAAQNIVQYNGQAATVVSASDTQLVVNIPAGTSSGTVSVQVGPLTATGPAYSTVGVGTLAGDPGISGLVNGQGSQAQFENLQGIVVDATGNLFAGDGNQIREISPYGVVTTFAGDPGGASGFTDGQGTAAQFNNVATLAIDKSGNLFVADIYNNAIRKITPGGAVTTFISSLPSGNPPGGVAVDAAGNVYVTDAGYGAGNVYEFNMSGAQINSYTIPAINGNPLGIITVDAMGNIYTTDAAGIIYKGMTPIVQLAGSGGKYLALDNNGNLLFCDANLQQIYSVNLSANNTLSLITGGAGVKGNYGYLDGPLNKALFATPYGITVDAQGIIYIADRTNWVIRKISLK